MKKRVLMFILASVLLTCRPILAEESQGVSPTASGNAGWQTEGFAITRSAIKQHLQDKEEIVREIIDWWKRDGYYEQIYERIREEIDIWKRDWYYDTIQVSVSEDMLNGMATDDALICAMGAVSLYTGQDISMFEDFTPFVSPVVQDEAAYFEVHFSPFKLPVAYYVTIDTFTEDIVEVFSYDVIHAK